MKRLLLVMIVAASGACGGDDDGGSAANPAVACEQAVEVICAKLFECYTEAEREAIPGFPANEGACISDGKDDAGCEEQTLDNVCDGGEVYDPGAASNCLDQLEAVECGQVRDGLDDGEAPACEDTCTVE